jgi:uncharacterized protein (DUF2141 family)
MDRLYIQIIWLLLLFIVGGCGQVGVITGGEDDRSAPKPISEKISPPMASKNTKPDRIIIPFDEFITLNNPLQNIRVVPDNVKLSYRIKGKSLVIEKESGEWLDNTTYAIYFKRAIKDITEGNDSIMTYVFATGQYIDSLTFGFRVVDAFSNQPIDNVVLGVYTEPLPDDTSKINSLYAGITDKQGEFQFQYLTEGPFYIYAFDDKNKNNRMNANETRATLPTSVYADTAVSIIHELRLMPPRPAKNEVKNIEFIAPSQFAVKFAKPLSGDVNFDFLHQAPLDMHWSIRRDSLTLRYGQLPKSGKIEFLVNHPDFDDTIRKKYFYREIPEFLLSTNLQKGVLQVGDTLTCFLPDALRLMEEEKIQVFGKKSGDTVSTPIPFSLQFTKSDEFRIVHPRNFDSIMVSIPKEAVQGHTVSPKTDIELRYEVQGLSKVGNLAVSVDSIPEFGRLYVLNQKKEVVREIPMTAGKNTYDFLRIQPGNYSFRILIDTDGDGFWSTGDIFTGLEPERIIWFDSTTQVRANWDVKAKLSLKGTPESEE